MAEYDIEVLRQRVRWYTERSRPGYDAFSAIDVRRALDEITRLQSLLANAEKKELDPKPWVGWDQSRSSRKSRFAPIFRPEPEYSQNGEDYPDDH